MYGLPIEVLILMLALAFDLALGELPNRLHPTVWIGQTISWAEKLSPARPAAQLVYGAGLALAIPAFWGGAAFLAQWGLNQLHPLAYLLVGALLLKTTFAVKMLHQAAAAVRSSLQGEDLDAAHRGMSALVSRDPSQLTREQTTAATVESVSENLTDSLVAPILAFALFGLPGAVAYRAINTLDSMIGYHGKYEYLGKASARFDDLVNLVPARLTALYLLAASFLLPGQKPTSAWRIMWRDHARTESPNAGWTMSGMAGALGITLEKIGHYQLGDPTRAIETQDISRAIQSLYLVTAQAALTALGIILAVNAIF